MSQNDDNPVVVSIRRSITKHGFPQKAVRLPFKPVYASCKRHGTALSDVLDGLKEEKILGTLEGDYIVFRTPEMQAEAAAGQRSEAAAIDPALWQALAGFPGAENPTDLENVFQQALARLDPKQVEELRQRVESMSTEEKQELLKMLFQMIPPPEQT